MTRKKEFVMKLWKVSCVALSLLWLSQSLAGPQQEAPVAYYGSEFYKLLKQQASDTVWVAQLKKVLKSSHKKRPNKQDEIGSCNPQKESQCYGHTYHSYSDARRVLFGDIFLTEIKGEYAIRGIYCDKYYLSSDFPSGKGLGPKKIPDPKIMNTEHSWPQSKFSNRYSRDLQKSDLLILYPVNSRVNSARSNHPFAEVPNSKLTICSASKMGPIDDTGIKYFEPADAIKGDIARSLFYFSIRYEKAIDSVQEYFLRKWHQEDPVDEFEMDRNKTIYDYQGIRNPFIDHPSLVQQVTDF